MKRFWVFVIICVVALGIGFTVFRFMTKEEILRVESASFEVNRGDNIELNIVQENLKAGTTIDVSITNPSILNRTGDSGYNFKAENGGSTTIVVTSNLKGFNPVFVQVNVGDGSYSSPYFIKNREQLASIGTATATDDAESLLFPLDKCYKLVSDINLTGEWTPIGANDDAGFTGSFDFNGHRISNMTISSATTQNIGLFAKIGTDGSVIFANMNNASITTNGTNIGTLAGVNMGTIENAVIGSASISTDSENVFVGGLVGSNYGVVTKSEVVGSTVRATTTTSVVGGLAGKNELKSVEIMPNISRSSAVCNLTGGKYIGGLVGQNSGAIIENCYAGSIDRDCIITNGSNTYAGGVVGRLDSIALGTDSPVRSYLADTYSAMSFVTTTNYIGGIVGQNVDDTTNPMNYNKIYGNYYSTDINPNIKPIAGVTNAEGIYPKTTDQLKTRDVYFSFEDSEGDVFWQFDEGVWTIDEGRNLPKLSFEVGYVSSRVQNYTASYEVDTYDKFVNLVNANAGEQYTLAANIVLPSGYTPFEFNAILICPIIDGNPAYKLTLTIDNDNCVVDGNAAVFTRLGANAKLVNIKVQANIGSGVNKIYADHVASIVAINDGALENCSASGTVTTDCATGNVYIGGLVAENHGKISGCSSSVVLEYAKAPTTFYVGGISAFSTDTLQNSRNLGTITITTTSEGYIGGVAGYTSSEVTKCANQGEITGEIEGQNTYFAGIVAKVENNINAKVAYCSSYGAIKGSNVGGVAGVSQGAVKYCYSSASIEGYRIGGLAYAVKQGTASAPSYISNCMTYDSNLIGANNSSIVCGVAYQIDVSEQHLAYGENIFTSAKFLGNGTQYYETTSNIRGDSSDFWNQKSIVDKNAFNNCIHVARDTSIKRSRFVKDFAHGWINVEGQNDIEITEEQAKGTDGGYAIFESNGYNTSIWEYNTATIGSYIKLKGIPAKV